MLSIPGSVKCGLPFTAKAVITNNASLPATAYKVVLYRDGVKAAETDGKEIAPGATAVINFEQTSDASWNGTVKYSFGIEFAADQVTANNISEIASVEILFSNYPTAENLKAFYSDEHRRAVNVEWTAPDQSALSSALYTEDFEFFTPFEADPICDWTFIDGDGDAVFGSSLFPFEGQNDPKAFVVLDADHSNRTYEAHSGHIYMASYSASTKQTDDWMISPELTGESQTVKLFARSYSDTYGLESFELLYSTAGKERADFVKLSTNNDVPLAWTEYTAELPAGAKYFAIHCISDKRFALFVDDVTYIPAVNPATDFAIEGFNIYRNGARLNSKPLLQPKYTDGSTIAVFAADGKTVFNAPVRGKHIVPVANGVYIVSSGSYVTKLIVR